MATEQVITDPAVTPEPSSDGPGSESFPIPAGTTSADFTDAPPVTETPSETTEAPTETPTEPVETPEVTLPFTIPDALRTPEPETQAGMAPDEIERLLSRNEELETEREKTLNIQSQNQEATSIQDRAQGYLNSYQLDNLDRDQIARFVATEVEKAVSEGRTNTQQVERQSQMKTNQRAAAIEIGNKHNVDPTPLMNLNSRAEMEREATWIVDSNKTRADIAALQKGRVPDQTFIDNGQGAGSGGRFTAAQLDDMTPAEYEKNRDQITGKRS